MLNLKSILRFVLLFAVLICTTTACENIVYTDCKDVSAGWAKDSVAEFQFTIDDTRGTYQTLLIVRNNDDYPHQNLWLFVRKENLSGEISQDTVQYFLADDFGRWIGSGIGSIFENVWIYEQRVKFREVGNYKVSVKHGMRHDLLEGIEEIGLKVIRTDEN